MTNLPFLKAVQREPRGIPPPVVGLPASKRPATEFLQPLATSIRWQRNTDFQGMTNHRLAFRVRWKRDRSDAHKSASQRTRVDVDTTGGTACRTQNVSTAVNPNLSSPGTTHAYRATLVRQEFTPGRTLGYLSRDDHVLRFAFITLGKIHSNEVAGSASLGLQRRILNGNNA